MIPRKAGSEEPPAPPPCEECIRLTVTGHGTFPYAGGHTLNLHAEIAELRAAIQDYIDSPVHGDHKGIYNPDDCCAPSARVRAALAALREGA